MPKGNIPDRGDLASRAAKRPQKPPGKQIRKKRARKKSSPTLMVVFVVLLLSCAGAAYVMMGTSFLKAPPPPAPKSYKITAYKVPKPPPPKTLIKDIKVFTADGQEVPLTKISKDPPPEPEAAKETSAREQIDAEVRDFIGNWKTAWENTATSKGDFATYTKLYASDFTHRGKSKSEWAQNKARVNRRKKWIKIRVSTLKIADPAPNGTLEVSFVQTYRSSNYSSTSPKTLVLKKERNEWRIIEER